VSLVSIQALFSLALIFRILKKKHWICFDISSRNSLIFVIGNVCLFSKMHYWRLSTICWYSCSFLAGTTVITLFRIKIYFSVYLNLFSLHKKFSREDGKSSWFLWLSICHVRLPVYCSSKEATTWETRVDRRIILKEYYRNTVRWRGLNSYGSDRSKW
jgi:hypothetical protein